MATCPKCKQEIDILHVVSNEQHYHSYYVDDSGEPQWELTHVEPQFDPIFYCPKCEAVLFEFDPIGAKAFMRGEK